MQEAYQEVAERALLAAKQLLESDLHELAGFCCYHAYESSASALAVNRSKPHGKEANHRRKLHIFLECVQREENRQIRDRIYQLNLKIGSARDSFLYPIEEAGEILPPHRIEDFSREQIEQLISEVEQVVQWVGHQIRT